MLLLYADIFDTAVFLTDKAYIAPDSDIGEYRTPVPAVHIVCLSDMRIAFHR